MSLEQLTSKLQIIALEAPKVSKVSEFIAFDPTRALAALALGGLEAWMYRVAPNKEWQKVVLGLIALELLFCLAGEPEARGNAIVLAMSFLFTLEYIKLSTVSVRH